MADKKPKLTVKEQKLIAGVVAGKPKYKAAIAAGYSPKSAASVASETLKKPNVQEALQIALHKHGLTPDAVIGVVAEGMKAEKVVIIGKDEDAFADVQADHSIRLKAAGMAANFMGIGKEASITVNGPAQFNQIAAKDIEEFGL